EDGIRCFHVTGVQTCALPILPPSDVIKELPSSFKTIQQTLFHMCWAENTWRQRLLLAEKVLPLNEDLLTDIPGLCKEFIHQSTRSEERRVGKESRARLLEYHL